MRLIIVIEAPKEELQSAFAAGPKDLRDHFLPEALGVKPERIVQITFEEPQLDGEPLSNEEQVEAMLIGDGYETVVHKDNFSRKVRP